MKNVSNYEVHSILAAWTEAMSSFKRSKEPFIIVGLFCIIILCKTQGCFWQKHINIMYLSSFQRVNKFLHERSVMSNKKSNHPLQILKTIKLKAYSNKAKQINSRVEQSRILCKVKQRRKDRYEVGQLAGAALQSVKVSVSLSVLLQLSVEDSAARGTDCGTTQHSIRPSSCPVTYRAQHVQCQRHPQLREEGRRRPLCDPGL